MRLRAAGAERAVEASSGKPGEQRRLLADIWAAAAGDLEAAEEAAARLAGMSDLDVAAELEWTAGTLRRHRDERN
jgi:hypothetical protein